MASTKGNLRQSILNFVKPLVSKTVYWEIRNLLYPCCAPTIEFGTDSCSSNAYASGVKFSGVTITDSTMINKTATLILASTQHGGGAIQTITFDANGVWTGDIQTSWYNSGGTEIVYAIIIPTGWTTSHMTEPVTITGVNNCN